MSIKVIKKQIDKFLKSDTPEVIAIKGAWGVGKTYTWKKFLDEAKAEKRVSLDKYSYVSLFGINSLEAFRFAIFENVVSKELIGTEANIETFKQNTTSLSMALGRRSLGLFTGIPLVKNFSSTIDSLSFLSLRKTLICIDDLERKGANLSIKDVLGLISQLKEQKGCKIVLLLNDGEDGLNDYVKYREKVIDIELAFAPTSEECVSIAFEGKGYVYETLKELTQKLGIKNIRVLKKIERIIELAEPYWTDYEQEIRYQFIHSLTLFTWCYYGADNDGPTLDFVTNLGYSFWGIGDNKTDSEEHKRWKTLLGDYGYQLTDDLDIVLAEAVRTGYFDEEKVKQETKEKNAQIVAAKQEGSFSDAWRLYHDTFANNQDEVVNTLYESFKRNAKNITPTNLNGTVRLFRDLGEAGKASELIDFYINLRKEEVELFNLDNNHFFGDVPDKEVSTKFKAAYSTSAIVEDAKQVLQRISGQNGWNQKDEVVLANTSADEYYKLFKAETGGHLHSYVRACLQFGQFTNASEQQTQIANRAREALLRIAGESEINRRRVKKCGVELER